MVTQDGANRGSRVVVVGAGPVGLSAAVLLARHGIACTVLEKAREQSPHPKARGMRPRTMELFAQWGVADELYRTSLPADANRFIYCESLTGDEYGRSPQMDADTHSTVTRARICRVAQNKAHSVLHDKVAQLDSVNVRMGVEVVDIRDGDHTATVITAEGEQIDADYVIAADGTMSTVRGLLDIQMAGDALQGYGQSVYWRGDLSRWTAGRMCIQFVTGQRGTRPSNIASVDGRDHWITMVMQPAATQRPAPPSEAAAIEIINAAVGDDVAPEILDITTWRIACQVAEQWRVGRIFLAGDAAHSFPPTGGFGMNTGVQDVHNLVWKLAAVLAGYAGDTLLDTYEAERKEIARSNGEWSTANGKRFKDINAAIAADNAECLEQLLADQDGHIDATSQDLAFGYAKGALAGTDLGSVSPLHHPRLGHRFPEMILVVDGEEVSSNTELGDHFTLAAKDATRWESTVATAAQSGLPLVLAQAPPEALAPSGAQAVLLRPDGIVGWVAEDATHPRQLAAALREINGATA